MTVQKLALPTSPSHHRDSLPYSAPTAEAVRSRDNQRRSTRTQTRPAERGERTPFRSRSRSPRPRRQLEGLRGSQGGAPGALLTSEPHSPQTRHAAVPLGDRVPRGCAAKDRGEELQSEGRRGPAVQGWRAPALVLELCCRKQAAPAPQTREAGGPPGCARDPQRGHRGTPRRARQKRL